MKRTNENEAVVYKESAAKSARTPGEIPAPQAGQAGQPAGAEVPDGEHEAAGLTCGRADCRSDAAVHFSGAEEISVQEGTCAIAPHAFEGCTFLQKVHLPHSIREIGEGAFRGCTRLTDIEFPRGLTAIGSGAFCDCKSLSRISLPEGLLSVGDAAFAGCTGLFSVFLPSTLERLGERVFDICAGLAEIRVAPGSRVFRAAGGCLVRRADRTLIRGVSDAKIPAGGEVLTIGEAAFSGCRGLTSLLIPPGVRTIADNAFMHCTALRETELGRDVISVGEGAFYNCPSLRWVRLAPHGALRRIGAEAFRFCDRLEEVAPAPCKTPEKAV